jgi:hypothetical protein
MSKQTNRGADTGTAPKRTTSAPLAAEQTPHTPPPVAEIIGEDEALRRIPVARRTWYGWRARGIVPYIRPPGTKRVLYHWPSVEAALLRMQRGGVS